MSQIMKKLRRGREYALTALEHQPELKENASDLHSLAKSIFSNIMLETFVENIVQKAEAFEFGKLGIKQVEDESKVALNFYQAGFLIPPFDNFIFTLVMDNGENQTGQSNRYDDLTIVGTTDRVAIDAVFKASASEANPADCHFIVFGMVESHKALIVAGVIGFLFPERCGPGLGFARLMGTSDVDGWVNAFFGSCWSILNTKGIELKRRGPTKEQHAALLAKGNTTGRPITYVGVKKYLEAREEAARMASSGTHASPRPHLRRGHIRQWRGRPVAVRPCIVNSTVGDIIKRDTYVVKHQGGHP